MRGMLAPPTVPIGRSRAERFEDHVRDAVEEVGHALPESDRARLAEIEFEIDQVPVVDEPAATSYGEEVLADGDVPLARLVRDADANSRDPRPAKIVVYRRPVQARAPDEEDLDDLLYEIVATQVSTALDIEIEDR